MIGALYLDSEEVAGLAEPHEFVDAVREAYRQRGEGAPTRPRVVLERENPSGRLNSYTAILPETGVMGGYVYSAGFEDADARFATPLFDARTGRPIAVVDGASMNPFKTGAAGAVGIDALARADASTLAVVGSGAQARGQVVAAVEVRDFDTIRVFSPTRDHREAFAADVSSALDRDVAPVESVADAVADADVIVTATTASEPVVADDLIPDGAHVNAIGQYDPNKREIDGATVARSVYVPDLRERAFQDAGAFLLALDEGAIDEDHIHAELGEVVAGGAPGREADTDVTVFDSGGTAVETVAAAHLLYEKARDAGLGRTIEFAPASEAMTGRQQ